MLGISPSLPSFVAPTGLKYLKHRYLPPFFDNDLIKYSITTFVSPYGFEGLNGASSSTNSPGA